MPDQPDNQVIKFDLLGQRRLVFDGTSVAYFADEIYPVPLPGYLGAVSIAKNDSLAFQDVTWIGVVRRRQWWMLGLGLFGVGLGVFWMCTNFPDAGPMAFSVGFTLLLGLLPLWFFKRGRPFLSIVAGPRAICIPMDRKRKQMRHAIEILEERCPPDRVRWEPQPADIVR
jgi:hypothetical protein